MQVYIIIIIIMMMMMMMKVMMMIIIIITSIVIMITCANREVSMLDLSYCHSAVNHLAESIYWNLSSCSTKQPVRAMT